MSASIAKSAGSRAMSAATPATRRKARPARRGARLAAVQAMYQMLLAGTPVEQVIAEFEVRPSAVGTIDSDFFRRLVSGAAADAAALDETVAAMLGEGWTLERLSITMRGLLRVAAWELGAMREVPPRVSVSEYVDIAHGFFDVGEAGFVNAVLETLARRLRAEEWQGGEQDGGEAG